MKKHEIITCIAANLAELEIVINATFEKLDEKYPGYHEIISVQPLNNPDAYCTMIHYTISDKHRR